MVTQRDITDTPEKAFYSRYGELGTALDDDWYLYIWTSVNEKQRELIQTWIAVKHVWRL